MPDDDHHRGLHFDLGTLMHRRTALGLGAVALGGVALLAGRGFGGEANVTGTAADGTMCLRDPVETSGPYPADGTNQKNGTTLNALTQSGILRSDMRTSFGDMSGTAEGVDLRLVLALVDTGAACGPLAGHAVYIWHCNNAGHYSLYDVADQNYLRAVGITDAAGKVRFTTFVPGCYDGRWPHMHFEVFTDTAHAVSGDKALLTSQIALPQAEAAALYAADAHYAASVANLAATSLAGDNVFGDNTPEQLAVQTLKMTGDPVAGYDGAVVIGL